MGSQSEMCFDGLSAQKLSFYANALTNVSTHSHDGLVFLWDWPSCVTLVHNQFKYPRQEKDKFVLVCQ